MRGKFSFLYVDIWFDLTKCKFTVKNSSSKILVVLSPIFVVDIKITFVYYFVTPLNERLYIINATFQRIDVSERIDVNKTSASKGCDICHY